MSKKSQYMYNVNPKIYIDIDITEFLNNINYVDLLEVIIDTPRKVEDKELISFTSYQKPFVYDKFMKVLYINKKYFEENKEIIFKILNDICFKVKSKYFRLSSKDFITDETINSLCLNENIKLLDLGLYDGYTLKKKNYVRFKKSNIKKVRTFNVVRELEDNLDPLIGYNMDRPLIDGQSINELENPGVLRIFDEVKQFKYLKYLSKDKQIVLYYYDDNQMNSFIKYMKKYGLKNKVNIYYFDKNKMNEYLLNHDVPDNFNINSGMIDENFVSVKEYIKNEKVLYSYIKKGLESNLSPLEKYLFAYNFVKRYRNYNLPPNLNYKEGRELYNVINSDVICCSGYVNLLCDLCSKLGLEITMQPVKLDTSYDSKEVSPVKYESHSIAKVKIEDFKYNIHGIYYSDPTFDVGDEKDLYVHVLMNANELDEQERYMKYDFYEDIVNVSNMKEYYKKLNRSYSELQKNNPRRAENFINDMLEYHLRAMQKLDSTEYEKFKKAYKEIEKNYDFRRINASITKCISKENGLSIINDLGKYFIRNYNRKYELKDLICAAVKVNELAEYDMDISTILNDNSGHFNRSFPVRYKIDKSNKITIMKKEDVYLDFNKSR